VPSTSANGRSLASSSTAKASCRGANNRVFQNTEDDMFEFRIRSEAPKGNNGIKIKKKLLNRHKTSSIHHKDEQEIMVEQPTTIAQTNADDKSNAKIERTNDALQPDTKNKVPRVNKRAVAVDTRIFMDVSLEEEAGGRFFLEETRSFLKLCARRGHLPLFYASCSEQQTTTGDTIKSKAAKLPLHLLTGWSCPPTTADIIVSEEEQAWNHMFLPVLIRDDSFQQAEKPTVRNNTTTSAYNSWDLFTSFVTNLVHEATSTNGTMPLDVCIVTSDIALFSDVSSDDHLQGLKKFWNKVDTHFDNGNVRSITITIVETGAASSEGKTYHASPLSNRLLVAQTLCNLRHALDSLHEDDNNNTKKGRCPMHISLEVIGCNFIEYGSMLRRWMQNDIRKDNCTLLIELPEDTLDGSLCTIRLGLAFKAFPYPPHVMTELFPVAGERKMKVIHVTPNDAVDASLIYGVAMVAEAAMDSDYDTYKDMKSLVAQLIKWLSMHDVSLLLCETSDKYEGRAQCNYYFLLTAETLRPDQIYSCMKTHGGNNDTGTRVFLFRYAASEQILDDGDKNASSTTTESSSLYSENDQEERQEIDRQYYDYIDRTLQLLDRSALNPVLLPGVNYQKDLNRQPHRSSFSEFQSAITPASTACSSTDIKETKEFSIEKANTAKTSKELIWPEITNNEDKSAASFTTGMSSQKDGSSDDDDDDIPCNYTFDDT